MSTPPAPPIPTNPNTPPQPPGFPDDDSKRMMMKTYGRLLTWPEYFARMERFSTSGDDFFKSRPGKGATKHR